MPTFATPSQIDLAVNVQVGFIEVLATDRPDTVVTVSGSNPGKSADRRAAEETKVDFDGQRLTVVTPQPRHRWIGPTAAQSVDVKVELPTGSRFTAEIAVGNLRTIGRLGATRIRSGMGSVELDATGDLWLNASHGNATLGTAEGGIEITANHGQIQVGAVSGDAILKASHGSVRVGQTDGDIDAKLSYGDLDVTSANGSVAAKTAYGSIQLHEVSNGSIEAEIGYGQIAIGVRPGVPAWLDLSSKRGHIRNELSGDRAPDAAERTVAVRARTEGGDITIRRTR